MKKSALLFFTFFVVTVLVAQPTQLMYLKTFPGAFGRLDFLESDSSYVFTHSFVGTSFNASIWPGDPPNTISPSLSRTVLIYNSGLHYQNFFEALNAGSNLRPLIHTDNLWYFNESEISGYNGQYQTIPPITGDYPSIIYGASNVLGFDENANSMSMPFHCDCHLSEDFVNGSPFLGFERAADAKGQLPFNRRSGTSMADGSIIRTLNMFHDIVLNWDDTLHIGDNYWGTVWVKLNPMNGNYIVTNMISQNGSALSHALFPSENHQFIYRTGVVRGNNVQISPDGTAWITSPQDSLYAAFIVKENENGEQEWMKELYAYSSNSPLENKDISTEMESLGLVEIDENVFLSQSVKITLPVTDSLLIRRFDGSQSLLSNPPSDSLEDHQIGYGTNTIYKFSPSGQRLASLSNSLDLNEVTAYQNNFNAQLPTLFKLDNKLAWLLRYKAQNDTTIFFERELLSGATDNLSIDLPAGNASYILLMDANFAVLGKIVFPYTGNGLGLNLTSMYLNNPDTLVISGYMSNNTSTRLDPSGVAPEINYTGFTSFIAFYTVPQILGISEVDQGSNVSDKIEVYPNPATGEINVSNTLNISGNYSVINTIGQIVKSGKFHANENIKIGIDDLNPGVYFVVLKNAEQRLVGRFVIE